MIIWPNTGDRENSHTGEKNGKNRRVLVVDDHSLFRQALSVVLERRASFDVYAEVASPEEARTVLAELDGRLDLAIVDLDLPDEGAEQVIRDLGERPFETSVLGLTAGRAAWTRGASEVLTTENAIDDILAAARQLVG